MKKIAFITKYKDIVTRQIKEKKIINVFVFGNDEIFNKKEFDVIERNVKPNKKEALLLDCANNVWNHGLATETFDFTIEKRSKKKKEKKYIKECPECSGANPYGTKVCISCGAEFEIMERKTKIKILNEDIQLINIDDVEVKERGLPDLEHIRDLFFIAKRRNRKTREYKSSAIRFFLKSLIDNYAHKFKTSDEFLKFLQDQLIDIIRHRHSYYRLKYNFMDYFKEENEKAEAKFDQMRSLCLTYKCPICNIPMKEINRYGEIIYFCSNQIHGGFSETYLIKNNSKKEKTLCLQ